MEIVKFLIKKAFGGKKLDMVAAMMEWGKMEEERLKTISDNKARRLICVNDDCENKSRHASKHCQDCSDKHNE